MGPFGQGYELVLAGLLTALPFIIGGLLISRFFIKTAKIEISNITSPTKNDESSDKIVPKTSKIISALCLVLSGTGVFLIWEFTKKGGQNYYRYLGNPYLVIQAGVLLVLLGVATSLISTYIRRK